jgi:3-hydroxy acid dehydrogenase / malonic semialdehyde reductase
MRLKGKLVCITGATSGFGAATARLVVREGARVIVNGRRKERLSALVEELGEDNAYALCGDVRENAAVQQMVASLPDGWRDVDVLVNNAGLALNVAPAQDVPLEQWKTMIDTNINGMLYVTRAFLSGMLQRNQGHIIMIGSMAGSYPYRGGSVYGATKAFVQQFAMNLRCDVLGTALRVTNLEPGLAETEFSYVRMGEDAIKAQAVYAGTQPLQAEDVAEAVVWCAALPAHVNINRMEIMPVCQAAGGLAIHRAVTTDA